MGIPTETRLESEELLTGHPVPRDEMHPQLQELPRKLDEAGIDNGNGAKRRDRSEERVLPPAGPHARAELTNRDLTPGTGMLADPESQDGNMQPSS
jgi:hypothetical protein